ncbi:unnamed protein product, partial [Staurois parvus]
MNAAARFLYLTNRSVSATLSANPSTGLQSVSSIPLCQSHHWLPLSVLHPSLPIPPLALQVSSIHSLPPLTSTQCPPSLSANPHSVSNPSLPIPPLDSTQCPPSLSANPSTPPPPLWPPLSVLHPSADLQSPIPLWPPLSVLHPLCQSLHWPHSMS